MTIWAEILIFNSKKDVHVITTSKKIEIGKINLRCWEITFYMYFSRMNTMYSSSVFIQRSHLDINEHILLIQTNWVGGLNEMSELLFLKRNAVLLFSRTLSNEANKMLPRRHIYGFILEL